MSLTGELTLTPGYASLPPGRSRPSGSWRRTVSAPGPILFLVFGTTFGALSALSALEHYEPCFIAAGFGFWGYGVYQGRSRTLLWVGLGA